MFWVRVAEKSEMDWINRCYDEVNFVHSIFERELIAIPEFDQQKAGIGRLVRIDSKNLELGGMYVFEAFQGRGVARKIVEFLLQHVIPLQKVYCIPFAHLTHFYQQFGFVPCSLEQAPIELLKKC